MTRFTSAREHLHSRGSLPELRRHARLIKHRGHKSSCEDALACASSRLAKRNGPWSHRQTFEVARALMNADASLVTIGDAIRWLAEHDVDMGVVEGGGASSNAEWGWSMHLVGSLVERLKRASHPSAKRIIERYWAGREGAIVDFCALIGVRRASMPADNDCQFWALMHQLRAQNIVRFSGTPAMQQQRLRATIVDWIETHLDDAIGDVPLRTLIEECEGPVSTFLYDMRRGRGERRWGNEFTLIACSLCFKLNVQVLHECGLRYCQCYAPQAPTGRWIAIVYDGVGHYDSVTPLLREA